MKAAGAARIAPLLAVVHGGILPRHVTYGLDGGDEPRAAGFRHTEPCFVPELAPHSTGSRNQDSGIPWDIVRERARPCARSKHARRRRRASRAGAHRGAPGMGERASAHRRRGSGASALRPVRRWWLRCVRAQRKLPARSGPLPAQLHPHVAGRPGQRRRPSRDPSVRRKQRDRAGAVRSASLERAFGLSSRAHSGTPRFGRTGREAFVGAEALAHRDRGLCGARDLAVRSLSKPSEPFQFGRAPGGSLTSPRRNRIMAPMHAPSAPR